MRAAVMEAVDQPLVVREVADPACPSDGAVVRVEANGICRSDWHMWRGHWAGDYALPVVMGHEMCGAVAAVNASNADPAEAIVEITKGGAQVSVDALGVVATCTNSIRGLRKRGRHVQIGVPSLSPPE